MKIKMNKKNISITIVILIIFLIGLKKTGVIGNDSSIKVKVEKVQRHTITETISVSGKIKPQTEVKISPEVSGEIIKINVKEGMQVKEGDLLVKIKPDIYISALERAKAALNSAKANLANQKARLKQAEAQMQKAQKDYERYKKLYEANAVSQAEYENYESTYEIKKSDYEAALQNVASAEFSVKSSEASVNEAEENLKKTMIYAPISGTVSRLNVEKGERVVGTAQMAGTELLTIADMDKMEVDVDVNENDVIKIKPGDTAKIEIDAYLNHPFKGIVTEVANSSNSTSLSVDQVTTFNVKILILKDSYSDLIKNKPKGFYPIRPGMSASVEIITNVASNVLAVPIEAVIVKEDTAKKSEYEAVFLYKNNKVYLQKVITGIQDDNYIEITKGLKEKDNIVTGPYSTVNKLLRNGMVVSVEKDKN